jgi:colanic acid biosynthesis glycosyl transferase WcaI
MKIVIYGINYAPELTGIGKYTAEMASWLASQGNTVHVITGKPYYPEWKIHKLYKWKLWQKEMIDGVTVYRCPLYVPKRVTPIKRILHEFSFIAGVIPVWLRTFFQKKYDLVICITPPFHLGIMPMLYSKIRGANFLTHIQDLQVDAAKNLVMLKSSRLLNMMFGAEKFILKRSTAVSTISSGMMQKIWDKEIPDSKTFLFPNWVDVNYIRPLPKEESLRKEFGISNDDKVILYSGNLGEKQGLNIIVDVAKYFITSENIHFVVVGSGGNKKILENLVKKNELRNVKFYPLIPYAKLPSLLAMADIHLVLQKKSASDLMMPSKLSGILASGGFPIVTALQGTSLYELIDKNNLGILVKPECPESLKSALEKALEIDLIEYRQNARNYAIKYLSKQFVLNKFEEDLSQMISIPGIEVLNRTVSG